MTRVGDHHGERRQSEMQRGQAGDRGTSRASPFEDTAVPRPTWGFHPHMEPPSKDKSAGKKPSEAADRKMHLPPSQMKENVPCTL